MKPGEHVVFAPGESGFDQCDRLLVSLIEDAHRARRGSILVGLCGAQGSGKSTTADRLATLLEREGRRVTVLSLDDFYLTRPERERLAAEVHPLLVTRGVPGTHDVALCRRTIDALLAGAGTVDVPCFDKLADTRVADGGWRKVKAPVDVVILEGWCVGARPASAEDLQTPINRLERDHDHAGVWRRYVNTMLETSYEPLFAMLDLAILLKAPSFDVVHQWRYEQELGLNSGQADRLRMSPDDLRVFIQHYERITRRILRSVDYDAIAYLDEGRSPSVLATYRQGSM